MTLKHFFLSTLFALGVSFAPMATGCSGEADHDHDHDHEHEHANYVCPMHPEVHQEEPGDCSICGMPLEAESGEEHEEHEEHEH